MTTRGYDPNQPRVPAGHPDGGQWTKDGSVAVTAARKSSGTTELIRLESFPDSRYLGRSNSSKAVLWNNELYTVKYRDEDGLATHLQILAQMVIENPDKFRNRDVEGARAVRDTGVATASTFEQKIQKTLGALTLEVGWGWNLVVVGDMDERPTSGQATRMVRDIQKAFRTGVINLKVWQEFFDKKPNVHFSAYNIGFDIPFDKIYEAESVRIMPYGREAFVNFRGD